MVNNITTKQYKKENINPLNKKCGDCVVRAISKALNKDWFMVLEDLYKLGVTIGCLPNDKETYGLYLKKYPLLEVFYIDKNNNKKRYSIKDLCLKYPNKTLIVTISNHLAVIKEGFYFDIWDCGDKKAYKIWDITPEEVI